MWPCSAGMQPAMGCVDVAASPDASTCAKEACLSRHLPLSFKCMRAVQGGQTTQQGRHGHCSGSGSRADKPARLRVGSGRLSSQLVSPSFSTSAAGLLGREGTGRAALQRCARTTLLMEAGYQPAALCRTATPITRTAPGHSMHGSGPAVSRSIDVCVDVAGGG